MNDITRIITKEAEACKMSPESFALKNGELHTLYEEWRILPHSDPKRTELEGRMEQLTSSLITPEGIEKVK